MKNKLISAKNSTKTFVVKHRTLITVVATATPLIMLQNKTAKELNAFLEEKGLLDEYYTTEEI